MILIAIKHKIYQMCIDSLFNAISHNFPSKDFILGSEINESHVGRRVIKIVNHNNPLMFHKVMFSNIFIGTVNEQSIKYQKLSKIQQESNHNARLHFDYNRTTDDSKIQYIMQMDDYIWLE
jgi:hypothetical protein